MVEGVSFVIEGKRCISFKTNYYQLNPQASYEILETTQHHTFFLSVITKYYSFFSLTKNFKFLSKESNSKRTFQFSSFSVSKRESKLKMN